VLRGLANLQLYDIEFYTERALIAFAYIVGAIRGQLYFQKAK